ncbi:hypothetical protein LSP03_19690 [Lysinibacillus sphaericus]|nr:hypothetical protein LS41612_22540 [Lysinibacillus sphaericus]GEC82226.1 hypothetical protein LSP03_19690 [Lysinibacillus sphaericus]
MNQEQLNAIKKEYSNMDWEYFRENAGDLLTDEIDIYNTVVIEGVPALIAEVERLNKELNKSKVEQMDLLTDKAFERSEKRKYIKLTHLVNEENKRLRKALEYYADTKHYEPYCIPVGDYASDVTEDNGEIARQALGGEADE